MVLCTVHCVCFIYCVFRLIFFSLGLQFSVCDRSISDQQILITPEMKHILTFAIRYTPNFETFIRIRYNSLIQNSSHTNILICICLSINTIMVASKTVLEYTNARVWYMYIKFFHLNTFETNYWKYITDGIMLKICQCQCQYGDYYLWKLTD